MGQTREQVSVVLLQPPVEGPVANAFDRMEQANSRDLTGPKIGLRVFGQLPHLVVHFTKQFGDKIFGSHAILPGWFHHLYLAGTA